MMDVEQAGSDVRRSCVICSEKILRMLRTNRQLTFSDLAAEAGITSRAIKKNLKNFRIQAGLNALAAPAATGRYMMNRSNSTTWQAGRLRYDDPQTIISILRTRPKGERLHRHAGAAVTEGNGNNADASFQASCHAIAQRATADGKIENFSGNNE